MDSTRTMKVFVAHDSSVRDWASDFSAQLKARGFDATSHANLEVGSNWAEQLKAWIAESDLVVAILGSPPSRWLHFEWGLAMASGKPLFAVVEQPLNLHEVGLDFMEDRVIESDSPIDAAEKVIQLASI